MCLDNNCLDCTPCPEEEVSYQEGGCTPEQSTLGSCSVYNSDDTLNCIGVTKGMSFNQAFKKIDEKVCEFVAGSDRRVGANDLDMSPGHLIDKLEGTEYISFQVSEVDGIFKVKPVLNIAKIAEEVCAACISTYTTTTIPVSTTVPPPTTTIPPTTSTTIPPTTTTLLPNVEVENNVVNSQILSVVGIPGFGLSVPLLTGEQITGRHNSFNSVIGVTIAGVGLMGTSLKLMRNGDLIQCIEINGPGTYTFDPTPFIIADRCSVITSPTSCASLTTTVAATTTTIPPTTTVPPPATTSTTTKPVNTIILSDVPGTSIVTVGGVSGFTLGQTVEDGEVIVGNHSAFSGPISITVFGVVSGASASLFKNGNLVQCVDVTGQGVISFSPASFGANDILQISFLPVSCVPATTSTTTVPVPPCVTYKLENTGAGNLTVGYTDCAGVQNNILLAPAEEYVQCAQEGSIQMLQDLAVTVLNTAGCFDCFTYEIDNSAAIEGASFEYASCATGSSEGGTVSAGSVVIVCARKNSVVTSAVIQEIGYGCGSEPTTTTVPAGTTTTIPPTELGIVYFGNQDSSTPPNEAALLGGTSQSLGLNPLDINWGAEPVTPKYYYFAVPARADYVYYYQSPLNNASIGTPSDLFGAPTPITVSGQPYELYFTNYATQFVNNGVYTFTETLP